MKEYYQIAEVADILGVSKETLRRWDKKGELIPIRHPINNYRVYHISQLEHFEELQLLLNSMWDKEAKTKSKRRYKSIELFAGAGGLALGMENAGFEHVLLSENNKDCCNTLKHNRPHWNVICDDIADVYFQKYKKQVDFVSGGFPCQAFSYAGKKLGFEDARGTLFYEFARCIDEVQPKILLAENVRGLVSHENGRTLETIQSIINELGYTLISPRVLKAIFYKVPQKRERLFLIGIRKDLYAKTLFEWPSPYNRIMTLRDAFYSGDLFLNDVPISPGQTYPIRKKEIMAHVPPGGYWRDLPEELQKEYMQKSFYLGGGKTGMARRLSLDEPSLTLTCAPAQKQTERCHPVETRPLTTREYARIQTFPDDWVFTGSMSSIYKQIGNAVPVNLAAAVGRSVIRTLNLLEKSTRQAAKNYKEKEALDT
ncbi:MAG: DNA (cytosine-5-)-methyltransferase [Legionellales bacterium]|nr:DNA (cytosine-5-)-methyltransferase [Legionellales bacterium]